MNFRLLAVGVAVFFSAVQPSAWSMGEESLGNEPLLNTRDYEDWPGLMPLINHESRVYRCWVNGNETFFYRGDSEALNEVLARFGAIQASVHEIKILPGPAETKTFMGEKTIAYDWQLHVLGGLAGQALQEQGTQVFDHSPTLTIYIDGDAIDLAKLKFPDSATLLDREELRVRYLKGLKNEDKEVRGRAAMYLAEVDPYNEKNAPLIATLLDDKDEWVRVMAAGALANLGKAAESALPALKQRLKEEGPYQESYAKAIEEIQKAGVSSAAAKDRALEEKIREFIISLG